jgi:SOS response regulatory protein OraA/RecX
MRTLTATTLVDHGIKLLSQRPHTRFELLKKLERRCLKQQSRSRYRISRFEKTRNLEYKSQELLNTRAKAEQTFVDCRKAVPLGLQELDNLGYIDDHEYAVWHIDQRVRFKTKSKREITKELLLKKVELPDITSALSTSAYCEEQACRGVVTKKTHNNTPSKLTTYLLRRGFPQTMVLNLVAERKEE